MKALAPIFIFLMLFTAIGAAAATHTSRVIKFYGIPPNVGQSIKKKFPHVFEREISLPEIDELIRFLMKSGVFSNVEAVDRATEGGNRETAIVASVLRRIQDVRI